MTLSDDLASTVKKILKEQWTTREGRKVPDSDNLKLANDAIKLDATVLYADLAASTSLVDGYTRWFAAEMYKSYLHCAAKIIRSEGGSITAYDGDRIMAVFIGDNKNTQAAKTGLKINYACQKIINPALKECYDNSYRIRQTVGIDTGDLFVARTGIRGSNDLVWVGPAANYAAKLTDMSPDYPTWISKAVYTKLADVSKYSDGKNMWESITWTNQGNRIIYRSNYRWKI